MTVVRSRSLARGRGAAEATEGTETTPALEFLRVRLVVHSPSSASRHQWRADGLSTGTGADAPPPTHLRSTRVASSSYLARPVRRRFSPSLRYPAGSDPLPLRVDRTCSRNRLLTGRTTEESRGLWSYSPGGAVRPQRCSTQRAPGAVRLQFPNASRSIACILTSPSSTPQTSHTRVYSSGPSMKSMGSTVSANRACGPKVSSIPHHVAPRA